MAIRVFYGYSLTNIMYDPNWIESSLEDKVNSKGNRSSEGDNEVLEDKVLNNREDIDEIEGEDNT